ncbi:pali-domain-containing protein [Agrocybe pediades]|nr:pali-domain-containing protein [Agrocybe pediades]
MGLIRPATPGFLVTLVATVLLAVVSFCVPYFKSVFFLKAAISIDGFSGNVTFGTLGYCLELSNGTTCSKPSIGYEIDINGLVQNKLPIEIPQVAVKWITYALFLHVIALIGAAGSAVFGLLAHVREMSMTCCSTFISGFAAVIAMLAFIFDLVLFFVAKSRINAVGSAQMGNAIWLTLAAWLLLFFSGCFYALGRCCISNRPRAPSGNKYSGGKWASRDPELAGPDRNEQLRLDAVKAEADRKARQKQTEVGLPAFSETQPLTARVDGDQVYVDGDEVPANHSQSRLAANAAPPARQGYAGGYVQAPPGTRAMDEYYASSPASSGNTYPPQQPSRQASGYAPAAASTSAFSNVSRSPAPQQTTSYGASPYAAYNAPMTTSPPPSNQLLGVPGQYNQDQYGREYGHTAGGSSYHTASSHDNRQPSSYSQYDPYATQSPPQQATHYAEPSSYHDPYNSPPMLAASSPNPYLTSPSPPHQQQYSQHNERSYTLGGDNYGASAMHQQQDYAYTSSSSTVYNSQQPPSTVNTDIGGFVQPHTPTSPVRGPRAQPGASFHEDAPPGYDQGTSGVTGNWGKVM